MDELIKKIIFASRPFGWLLIIMLVLCQHTVVANVGKLKNGNVVDEENDPTQMNAKGCRQDVVYELRVLDVAKDGGTEWMYTDRQPAIGMEDFSKPESKIKGLVKGRSPLITGKGWRLGKFDYWVRKEFDCPVDAGQLFGGNLFVDAEKSVEVWLNGEKIYEADEHTWHYHKKDIDVSGIVKGKNVLAAHVQVLSADQRGILDIGFTLYGAGLYKEAVKFAGKRKQFIPVDVNSLSIEDAVVKSGLDGGCEWKYMIMKPVGKWSEKSYDDSKWNSGTSGFGGGTVFGLRQPGLRSIEPCLHTKWIGDDLWLRTEFECQLGKSDIGAIWLSFRNGGDITIYVNGKKVVDGQGLYKSTCASTIECDMWNAYDMTATILPLIVKGKNVIAAYVHDVGGKGLTYWGRNADLGLYIRKANAD